MKWTTPITACLALGGITSALPTQLDDPDNLAMRNTLAKRQEKFCEPPHLAGRMYVGGRNGDPFCGTKWPGPNLLKTLTTYSSGNDITGIEISYTDGSNERWGKGFNTKNSGSITLSAGELVTSAWLAGNGKGTRLGKIRLTTNKQSSIELGTSNAADTYPVDVGSGLLVGITGHSGSAIDNLALLFVRPKITDIHIGNMQLDKAQLAREEGKPARVAFPDQVHYWNDNDSGNQSYTFSNTRELTSSTTISSSTAGEFGQTIGFQAEFTIPEILSVSVKNEIAWKVTRTTGTTNTRSETFQARYLQSGTLLPKTGADCTAIIYEAAGTFGYSSTVTISFDDGTNFAYEENGQLKTNQFTQAESTCKQTKAQDPPPYFESGRTVDA